MKPIYILNNIILNIGYYRKIKIYFKRVIDNPFCFKDNEIIDNFKKKKTQKNVEK